MNTKRRGVRKPPTHLYATYKEYELYAGNIPYIWINYYKKEVYLHNSSIVVFPVMRELEYENNTMCSRAGKNSTQLPAYFVIGDQIYYFLLEFVNKGKIIEVIQSIVNRAVFYTYSFNKTTC